MKKTILCLVIGILFIFSSSAVFAHRVNVFAWVEGDTVYTESKFSGGKKAKGALIEVFTQNGKKLLEGKTDSQGIFSFKIKEKTGLKVVLTAGMGHKNQWLLSADEIAGNSAEDLYNLQDVNLKEKAHTENNDLKTVISQLKSLQKEYQKIKLRDIIGGIGYIFGLFGTAAFFYSRKKR